MSKNNIVVGIDVGTSKVKAVVASIRGKEELKPKIIGVGESIALGMRKGMVVDIEEMTKSIRKAIDHAERVSGIAVEKAYIAIGGSHIKARPSKGIAAISRADEEVSEGDVLRAIENASAISIGPNKEVLDIIPREFNLDGQEGIQDPRGMNGVRLEVDTLIIEGQAQHLKNLRKCFALNRIEIKGMILNILAASDAVLSKKQKELGVMVLDFGAGTVGMSVYEEGKLLDVYILPVGSVHITNDIAIGLRTSVEVAEKIKLTYGSCLPDEISKKDSIDLSKIDSKEESVVSRRELASIIEARIDEILGLINKELRRINRERMLPAGVVLIGGGSKIPGIIDLVKERLKLNAQIGYPQEVDGLKDKVDDPSYAAAVGLIFRATELSSDREGRGIIFSSQTRTKGIIDKIKRVFRIFVP